MKLTNALTDDAALRELGKRIAQLRIESSLTQAHLAERAGVGKRTVERLELGESVQSVNLIRVLRVLGLLGGLDALIPEQSVRPMDLLRKRVKPRRRASSPRYETGGDASWVWEDEK